MKKLDKIKILELFEDSCSVEFVLEKLKKTDAIFLNTNDSIDKKVFLLKRIFLKLQDVKNTNYKFRYFVSNRYFLLKDRVYECSDFRIDKESPSFLLGISEKFVMKFLDKDLSRKGDFYDAGLEIDNLIKFSTEFDYIKKQELVDFEKRKDFITFVRKKIRGDSLSEIVILDHKVRLKIIKDLLSQLVDFEKQNLIYNDTRTSNVLVCGQCVNFIDLGSFAKKSVFRNNNNNFLQFLLLIYNLFRDSLQDRIQDKEPLVYFDKLKIRCVYNYPVYFQEFVKSLNFLIHNNSSFLTIKKLYDDFYNKLDLKEALKQNNFIKQQSANMKTKKYIQNLKDALPLVNSVADINCALVNLDNKLDIFDDESFQYIGLDSSKDLIDLNRQKFYDVKNKFFMLFDIEKAPLPQADLIVCANLSKNVSKDFIWKLLENIRNSKCKYFAFDYNSNKNRKNALGKSGQNVEIDFCLSPFYFPEPLFFVSKEKSQKFIAVYEVEKVKYYMESCDNEDMCKLRSQLTKDMEYDAKKLWRAFVNLESGKKLYKNLLIDHFYIEEKEHNQKYYYDEPYRSLVDDIDVLIHKNVFFWLYYNCELERFQKETGRYKYLNKNNFKQVKQLSKEWIINHLSII